MPLNILFSADVVRRDVFIKDFLTRYFELPRCLIVSTKKRRGSISKNNETFFDLLNCYKISHGENLRASIIGTYKKNS